MKMWRLGYVIGVLLLIAGTIWFRVDSQRTAEAAKQDFVRMYELAKLRKYHDIDRFTRYTVDMLKHCEDEYGAVQDFTFVRSEGDFPGFGWMKGIVTRRGKRFEAASTFQSGKVYHLTERPLN